ncbi:MAG: hypothetical protein HZY75_04730 [Nocardioidaceae bacterium]|nr:MAG: hypothetical protein HZY75_04730 [Nocardioidaceae bacterium]
MIHIDIDADLNMVDDNDRNMAPCPAGSTSFEVGQVAVAGRPRAWSWVLIDEISDTAVYFHQISAKEAASYGDLVSIIA